MNWAEFSIRAYVSEQGQDRHEKQWNLLWLYFHLEVLKKIYAGTDRGTTCYLKL